MFDPLYGRLDVFPDPGPPFRQGLADVFRIDVFPVNDNILNINFAIWCIFNVFIKVFSKSKYLIHLRFEVFNRF